MKTKFSNDERTHYGIAKVLITVWITLSTFLNFYLIGEIKNVNEALTEESLIKYEYSSIIDSLTTELELAREVREAEIIHSEWEFKNQK
jgi:hypothetical protein